MTVTIPRRSIVGRLSGGVRGDLQETHRGERGIEEKIKESMSVVVEQNDKQLRHRETTGAIIIDTSGRYLFQLRDDVAGIASPGKIGLFGGHREGDETFLECIVREIHEEIGYFVPAERFEHLGSFDGEDIESKRGTIHGHLFVARDIPVDALDVTEGTLLIVEPTEIDEIQARLAPTTRLALKAYLNSWKTVQIATLQPDAYTP